MGHSGLIYDSFKKRYFKESIRNEPSTIRVEIEKRKWDILKVRVPLAFTQKIFSNSILGNHMAKKPRTKDRHGSFKRMLKNQQLLLRTLVKHPKLNQELVRLGTLPEIVEAREKIKYAGLGYPNTLRNRFDNYDAMMGVGLKIASSTSEDSQRKLISFIDRFLAETAFGDEWVGPLFTYVTTGIICPPYQNFHLKRKGNRIQLTLNPDTSIDDIKNEWPKISVAISQVWPNFKKTNLTRKFNGQLQEYIDVLASKKNISDDFKYQELSQFETILAKQAKDPKKAISAYRDRQRIVAGVPKRPIRIKTKKTDRDVVNELYSPKNKKVETKKVNNLRQHLKRLKS